MTNPEHWEFLIVYFLVLNMIQVLSPTTAVFRSPICHYIHISWLKCLPCSNKYFAIEVLTLPSPRSSKPSKSLLILF